MSQSCGVRSKTFDECASSSENDFTSLRRQSLLETQKVRLAEFLIQVCRSSYVPLKPPLLVPIYFAATRPSEGIVALLRMPPVTIAGDIRSQVKDDLFLRFGAADEQVALRGRLQRFRLVAHRSRDESAFTGVANPRPARPPDRHVASFGQFQQVAEPRAPRHREAASRERNIWAIAEGTAGLVRRSCSSIDNSRSDRFAGPKDFRMNAFTADAPRIQARY